jgi:hypothetical protein
MIAPEDARLLLVEAVLGTPRRLKTNKELIEDALRDLARSRAAMLEQLQVQKENDAWNRVVDYYWGLSYES